MKILLTGGGSGGHVYPVVAVASALRDLARAYNISDMRLFYMSTDPFDEKILKELDITFIYNAAGKRRRYASIRNFFDFFKTGWGILTSMWKVFSIFPDIIFGKGGYASFPALVAARILRIPVVIHESDTVPGRVNQWAGKFAERVAVSYPSTSTYFDQNKIAITGQPIREEVSMVLEAGAHEFFGFDKNIPTLLILGGSLGAGLINDAIMEALPDLLKKYQIIHQTGEANLTKITKTAEATLYASEYKHRYKPLAYLDVLSLRMASGAATLIISRAGSTIFEIAAWGKPSIIIPITDSNADHQRTNAYEYARSGAATVIEEKNLTKHILLAEINRIVESKDIQASMSEGAHAFFKPGAAQKIASEILEIVLEHDTKS